MKKFIALFTTFFIALFAFTLIGSPAQAAEDFVVFNGDGVLTVEGDWDEDTLDVGWTGTLADIGTELEIVAEPLQYVGLHIHTALGNIVFEEEPSYEGKLWSNVAWPGVEPGMGYAAFGTIEQFIAQNGAVAVTGITLLYTHPEASSTTVTSFTIADIDFSFAEEVVEPEPTETPTPTEPAVVTPVTPAPSAVGTAPVAQKATLAETGPNEERLFGILLVGLLLAAFGATAIIVRRRIDKTHG